MVKHIVFWKVSGEKKEEIIDEMKSRLLAMKGKIDGLMSIEVGVNFNSSEFAHDVALITTHPDKESLLNYQNDPVHRDVASYISGVVTARAVADYEIE